MPNPRTETGDHRSYLSFQFYKTIYLKDKNSISKNNAKMISSITGRSGDMTNNIICPYQPIQSLLPYLRPTMTITKPKPLFLLLLEVLNSLLSLIMLMEYLIVLVNLKKDVPISGKDDLAHY